MALHVAVVDPLPMFQRGVAAVLFAAGHAVDAPEDVLAWARSGHRRVVLLTLLSGHAWHLLGRLRDTASAAVVVLLEEQPEGDESAAVGVRAVRAGATSVLPRGSAAGVLLRTVEATADGQAVLPREVVAALAGGMPAAGVAQHAPSAEQLSWLRELSAGLTVAQLAGRVGYSERAMFRLLKSLYRDMGVETRVQAILRAQEQGWLSAGAGRSPRRS